MISKWTHHGNQDMSLLLISYPALDSSRFNLIHTKLSKGLVMTIVPRWSLPEIALSNSGSEMSSWLWWCMSISSASIPDYIHENLYSECPSLHCNHFVRLHHSAILYRASLLNALRVNFHQSDEMYWTYDNANDRRKEKYFTVLIGSASTPLSRCMRWACNVHINVTVVVWSDCVCLHQAFQRWGCV